MATSACRKSVAFCTGIAAAVLLHALVRGRSVPPAPRRVHVASSLSDAQLLSAVHTQQAEVRSLLGRMSRLEDSIVLDRVATAPASQTTSATTAVHVTASTSDAASNATDAARDPGETSKTGIASTQARACAMGCERHGNCDPLTGKCSCPPTYEGVACEVPTMPDCSTADVRGAEADDDAFVNLSGLASEAFWWMMRDVRPDPADVRRVSPPYRWVGLVTCRCVRQAVAMLSLQSSPEPAAWPRYIGHSEIAMNRAVCIDEPSQTVGELWATGGTRRRRGLRWSYVPVVAWLKPYPAHSPQVLPFGLVTEEMFTANPPGGDKHLMYLQHSALRLLEAQWPPPPPPRPLEQLLPHVGSVHLQPSASCGAHRCHAAGWCGVWSGA